MKKIVLVAVAATAVAAPTLAARAGERGTAASTYVVERPDSSERSGQKATAIVLRDRRPSQVAAVPRPRP